MISHRLMSGCVVGGWSGVWESGEDPGWNLSYSTRCCPVLLHRLLIGIMSLFKCGLPKETPVLKNVLFCVVLVPKTRDRHAIIYSTHPSTQTFSRLFLYTLLKITVHNLPGLLIASKHLLMFPYGKPRLPPNVYILFVMYKGHCVMY